MNDVLMICVVNCKLHKIREYLQKLSIYWHLTKYCVLDVFSDMISGVLFGVKISGALFGVTISSVLLGVTVSGF